jgi:hypothetical protein
MPSSTDWLPAVSIAWGLWDGEGMASGLGDRDRARLRDRGIGPIGVAEALGAFECVLGTNLAHVGVFRAVAALAEPVPGGSVLYSRPAALGEYVAACGSPERTLVAIWEQAFAISPIGVTDDFFALGGDSILSLQVTAAARQAGIVLDEAAIFEHPTIAGLAAFLASAGRPSGATAGTGPEPTPPDGGSAASPDPGDVARVLARLDGSAGPRERRR